MKSTYIFVAMRVKSHEISVSSGDVSRQKGMYYSGYQNFELQYQPVQMQYVQTFARTLFTGSDLLLT